MTATTDRKFRRWLDGLDECKSALDKITPAYLDGLSDDEFADVVITTSEFFNSLQLAANRLELLRLREQRNALREARNA